MHLSLPSRLVFPPLFALCFLEAVDGSTEYCSSSEVFSSEFEPLNFLPQRGVSSAFYCIVLLCFNPLVVFIFMSMCAQDTMIIFIAGRWYMCIELLNYFYIPFPPRGVPARGIWSHFLPLPILKGCIWLHCACVPLRVTSRRTSPKLQIQPIFQVCPVAGDSLVSQRSFRLCEIQTSSLLIPPGTQAPNYWAFLLNSGIEQSPQIPNPFSV